MCIAHKPKYEMRMTTKSHNLDKQLHVTGTSKFIALSTVIILIYTIHTLMSFFHIRLADCLDGQLRLIQHYIESSGRIEICSNRRWETLSYREWTSSNAHVACNELGFAGMFL